MLNLLPCGTCTKYCSRSPEFCQNSQRTDVFPRHDILHSGKEETSGAAYEHSLSSLAYGILGFVRYALLLLRVKSHDAVGGADKVGRFRSLELSNGEQRCREDSDGFENAS